MKTLLAAVAVALVLTSCGTSQSTTTTAPAAQSTEQPEKYDVHPVDVKSEVLTISDGIKLFDDNSNLNAMAQKYGYKKLGKYEAHNLNSYDNMLYKNCSLPKKMKDGSYMDMPKPMKNGVSSYVGMVDGKLEIGVFNTKSYNQLVEQVEMAGFKLAQDGYEKEYSNGVYSIFCYAPGKRVRIAKTL